MSLSAEAIIGIIGIVLVAPHTVFAIEKRCSRRKRHTAQGSLCTTYYPSINGMPLQVTKGN